MHKSKAILKVAIRKLDGALRNIESVYINSATNGKPIHSLLRTETELANIINQLVRMYLHKKNW